MLMGRQPFFRPLRGDLVRGARTRARTVPGSLFAAFRGSCPHHRAFRIPDAGKPQASQFARAGNQTWRRRSASRILHCPNR